MKKKTTSTNKQKPLFFARFIFISRFHHYVKFWHSINFMVCRMQRTKNDTKNKYDDVLEILAIAIFHINVNHIMYIKRTKQCR